MLPASLVLSWVPAALQQEHGPDEYVEVAQLETAVEVYRSIMLNY